MLSLYQGMLPTEQFDCVLSSHDKKVFVCDAFDCPTLVRYSRLIPIHDTVVCEQANRRPLGL